MSETSAPILTVDALRAAVAGDAVAIRIVTELTPAGGAGDKVFPASYEGGFYHFEDRRLNGETVKVVVIDSVQSQANRFEQALQQAYDARQLEMPLLIVDLKDTAAGIPRLTALEVPHRIADAIIRDTLLDGVPFRDSVIGKGFVQSRVTNASALFESCPTALLFGVWDSTSTRAAAGGSGAKFQRAIVSEVVGFHAVGGYRSSSRIDPLQIGKGIPIFKTRNGDWTADEAQADRDDKGQPRAFTRGVKEKASSKSGKPTTINHGNITPGLTSADDDSAPAGGVSIDFARQTTVLSLAALRRLQFPPNGQGRELAARTVLAALGLAGWSLSLRHGFDLRSRCLLVPTAPSKAEWLYGDGRSPSQVRMDQGSVFTCLNEAIQGARTAGWRWAETPVVVSPSPAFAELLSRNADQRAVAEEVDDDEEA